MARPAPLYGNPRIFCGFQDAANLDDGDFWPTSYAMLRWSPKVEEQVVALVRAAVA